MQLRELLPYIDCYAVVAIWQNIGLDEERWEIVYEGDASEVPWYIAEKHLIDVDANGGSEAICPFTNDDGVPSLRITLGD